MARNEHGSYASHDTPQRARDVNAHTNSRFIRDLRDTLFSTLQQTSILYHTAYLDSLLKV